MKIVIIGGTGRIGSAVTEKLRGRGHDVLPVAPSTGVDTLTGDGLDDALAGAEAVVDVSNSPSFADEPVMTFFRTSTTNLLAAGTRAGVGHLVVLSIVGTDRAPDSGYLRAKVAQEELVTAGPLPYTIVRSTQFFEFLPGIADASTVGDEIRLTDAALQPISADNVSTAVADAATAAPTNAISEIAGPRAVGLDDLVRGILKDGDPRHVVTDHSVGYFGAVIEDDTLTPGPGARIMA